MMTLVKPYTYIASERSRAATVDGTERRLPHSLSLIARLSRELVEFYERHRLGHHPRKDQLSDLSQRMRHFASDVFTVRRD